MPLLPRSPSTATIVLMQKTSKHLETAFILARNSIICVALEVNIFHWSEQRAEGTSNPHISHDDQVKTISSLLIASRSMNSIQCKPLKLSLRPLNCSHLPCTSPVIDLLNDQHLPIAQQVTPCSRDEDREI